MQAHILSPNEKEIWKKVSGFDQYEVSNLGRIRSYNCAGKRKVRALLKPRILKLQIDIGGYYSVGIYKNEINAHIRKVRKVHRLVLEAFVGKCPPGMECAHLDGNPLNNKLDNLKWCSSKENNSHKKLHGTHRFGERHQSAKYSAKIVRAIRKMYDSKKTSATEISRIFNIGRRYVSKIASREIWADTN